MEFILCHAEVQIAFVEEKKIGEVCFILPWLQKYLFMKDINPTP